MESHHGQGLRVLVTAHTDRALKEVREKLPGAIKPLAVSIVGSSREDMADLKVAVQRISEAAAGHDSAATDEKISQTLDDIDQLQRLRARLRNDLVAARTAEVDTHERAGYSGTVAAIAQQLQADAPEYEWIIDLFDGTPDSAPPLSGAELRELHGYLTDSELAADGTEARLRIIDVDTIPEPELFARQVATERTAADRSARYESTRTQDGYAGLSALRPEQRREIKDAVDHIVKQIDRIKARPEAWLPTAVHEVLHGHGARWINREQQISHLIGQCSLLVTQLGHLTRVEITGERDPFVRTAQALLEFLRGGGRIKVEVNGTPKIGAFAAKVVKQAEPFFAQVSVNGLPATDTAKLDAFVAWGHACAILDALDKAWPDNVVIPPEDTIQERLIWHVTESEQLRAVLRLGRDVETRQREFAGYHGVVAPAWGDPDRLRSYLAVIEAADAQDAYIAAAKPAKTTAAALAQEARWDNAAPAVVALNKAAAERDQNAYAVAYQRISRLIEVRRTEQRQSDLMRRLTTGAPALAGHSAHTG